MIDVVTMRFGPRYGPEYIQRWASSVHRALTVPHRLVCFTDDPHEYDPRLLVCLRADLGGWWNHLWAFSGWTLHPQLLIDLDDVIVGSLDDLASYRGPHALNSDVYRAHQVDGGCQLIPAPANVQLYKEFCASPGALRAQYYSDKEYYVDRVNDAPRLEHLFPGQWVSYKVHCEHGLPDNARIVGFHGEPKPDQVSAAWVAEHWRT